MVPTLFLHLLVPFVSVQCQVYITTYNYGRWLRHVPNSALLLGTSKLLLEVSALKLSICLRFKGKGLDGKLQKLAEKFLLECFHNKLSLLAINTKNDFVLQWKVIHSSCLPLCTSAEQTCWCGLFPRQGAEESFALLTEFHQLLLDNALYTLFLHFHIYIYTHT